MNHIHPYPRSRASMVDINPTNPNNPNPSRRKSIKITTDGHGQKSSPSPKDPAFPSAPDPIEGVVPGFEVLAPLTSITIKREADWKRKIKKFHVFDPEGNLIYLIRTEKEKGIIFSKRIMHVKDALGNGFDCTRDDGMTITATSDGHFVGKIVRRACRLGSAYNVLDEKGEVAFSIRREAGCCGCGCGCCCGSDSDMIRKFLIFKTSEKEAIGEIVKKYGLNVVRNCSVSFPVDLAVEMKAALLGAALQIDGIRRF